jgi:hypothetical protein
MPDRFLQAAPPPGDGGPSFTIDLSGLGTAIWQALLDHLGEIGTASWNAFSQWLYSTLRALFLAIWNATLLPIPHDVTDQFTPVLAMMPATGAIAAAGLVLAMTLLGLRTFVHTLSGRSALVDELFGRVMVWTCVLSLLPWLIEHAIDLEQALARSVAIADLAETLPEISGPFPSVVIALLLMIVLGIRLWLKLASNVVHVAVAIVWSPVAAVCGLYPETAWVTNLWVREFAGRLAGAVLATIASGVGLALALTHANGGSGFFVIFGVCGAFIAAHDLVDWMASTPGTTLGGVVGPLLRTGASLAGLGLAVGAGSAAAGALSGGTMQAAPSTAPQLGPATALSTYYSFD